MKPAIDSDMGMSIALIYFISIIEVFLWPADYWYMWTGNVALCSGLWLLHVADENRRSARK